MSKTNGHAAHVSLEAAVAAAVPEPAPPTGIADVLSPSQVRSVLSCAFAWFCKSVLKLPDPPTSVLALGKATHAAIATNFRYKLTEKKDLVADSVVELFQRAWAEQLDEAVFRNDEDPREIGAVGEKLTRIYMRDCAPSIMPAEIELPVSGVIAGVRVRSILDLLDVNGKINDTKTSAQTPSSVDPMYRFQVTTYSRLAPNASGLVQLDTLVKTQTPKVIHQSFTVTEADIKLTDTLYPLAQQAMRSGYYMPNRLSMFCSRRHCAFWRHCEKEFGGTVDQS